MADRTVTLPELPAAMLVGETPMPPAPPAVYVEVLHVVQCEQHGVVRDDLADADEAEKIRAEHFQIHLADLRRAGGSGVKGE